MNKKLYKIYKKSKIMNIDDNSKIIIMSDVHRGNGNNYDNFIKNKNIFIFALQYYYNKGFTYIELGDGDEMWEVKYCNHIIKEHLSSFKQLKKFNNFNRLIMLYGNHDIEKRKIEVLQKNFYMYYNEKDNTIESLLDGLNVLESLILKYKKFNIFLIHGHQLDFINSSIWPISRLVIRHFWKKIEHIGIKDPTDNIENYKVAKKIEKKLHNWSKKNNIIIIAGHTHRSIFPKVGNSLYFNTGSCIHPDGITALEIENGKIRLVKWQFKINKGQLFSVERKIISYDKNIKDFFM